MSDSHRQSDSPDRRGQAADERRLALGELERQVRGALAHLYDLAYLQNHLLASLIQPRPRTGRSAKPSSERLSMR